MGLRDIFKKKKKSEKGEEEQKTGKVEPKEEAANPAPFREEKKGKDAAVYDVLKFPHISEKATALAKGNQYLFNVYDKANKIEIKKAIKGLYGVDVVSVRTIKVPRRQRRLGNITGWKKGYKKAIVKIKKGQEIEVIPR